MTARKAKDGTRDAVALLKADHRKVEDLFEKFESAQDAEEKRDLAREICTELCAHTIIEEEIFYPACTGEVEDNTVDEAYVEHDGAKVLIAELLAGDPDDEFYEAKVKVLSEDIKHHVKEEEKRAEGLFAQAKAAGLDMAALGDRLSARKEEILANFRAQGVPPPQTRSFTGHELQQTRPVDGGTAAHSAEAA
jgi:hemerythrin superfamily protein